MTGRLRIAVAIATAGRPTILGGMLATLADQTRAPDAIIVCAPTSRDFPPEGACDVRYQRLDAERGLCRQRNAILAALEPVDIVLFIDDDFILAPDYLEELERLFDRHPDVVVCTGTVLADGIGGPGYGMAEGLTRLADELERIALPDDETPVAVNNAYGCNMGLRMSAIRDSGARFDETLPLYGWLEDVDFSRQMARCGSVVRSPRLRGVHLGTKLGRTPGRRLGYSQIANPVYLVGKGTMSRTHAAFLMARNMAANVVRSLRPEPWVDRRGRAGGNLQALADLLRARIAPGNVLDID